MRAGRIITGIIAHVDSGKTTLAESMLYASGNIKKLGRVDHRDTFLDTNELERERGITIFSKQAELKLEDKNIVLLDTPGHVDFSAETERAFLVMDYVILVINGSEGIQSHVLTLWKLLNIYKLPVFIFINKMDMPDTDRDKIMDALKKELSANCVCFTENDDFYEDVATGSEEALSEFLDSDLVSDDTIRKLIKDRSIYPCFFGSALRLTGVEEFLHGLDTYMEYPKCSEAFGAKVYKITRDEKGMRESHMKITGGVLRPKQVIGEEKINQIRIYSGASFVSVNEALPGTLCAVTGLADIMPGQGIGYAKDSDERVLAPVLTYRLILPENVNAHDIYTKVRVLEEEEPELSIVWNEKMSEINLRLMGEIQLEVLRRIIRERFDLEVSFDKGSIVYKETLAAPVEGVGHYEPLRHYAEVHIYMEPGERGSGIQITSDVSEDVLDRNWQRLIMTHLEEKKHLGVLTGSEITDIKITVVNGRAHLKHTEGGDFREASYRAVRHGLMRGMSVLLEPVYNYSLRVPSENLGRAINDIAGMNGSADTTVTDGDFAILSGTVPVECIQGYNSTLASYTKGKGSLTCTQGGYVPCHNAEEVIEKMGYDPVCDIANPAASIFCAHGAGFYVSWEQVEEYMHLPYTRQVPENDYENETAEPVIVHRRVTKEASDDELDAIFEQTFGAVKRRTDTRRVMDYNKKTTGEYSGDPKYLKKKTEKKKKDDYLLVDGYNIIYAWDELKELAKDNLESARIRLAEILCNYQGYRSCTVILVFDAYRVKGNPGSTIKYNNIHIVYTKEAETADSYIEKTVHRISRDYNVTVATSDATEQIIIFGAGAIRLSANGLKEEIARINQEISENIDHTR